MIKRYFIATSAALAFLIPLSYAETKGKAPVVASVLGKEITQTEIDPSKEELKYRLSSGDKESEALDELRHEALATLIVGPLMEDFVRQNKITVSKDEIANYIKAAKPTEEYYNSFTEPFSEEEKRSFEKGIADMAEGAILSWKVSKALYEKYGGTVIFQQSNPMEPVGAYRAFLEEHEKAGRLKIIDEKLKAMFWEYYRRDHPMQIPKEQVDYSKPWWSKKAAGKKEK